MRLGYIYSRHPLLSETFILREMVALRRLGHELTIAPLRAAAAPRRHALGAEIEAEVEIAPWFSPRLLAAHARRWRRAPGRYAGALGANLWAHKGRANALLGCAALWPKIAAIAARFERAGVEHIHAHYATHPAMAAWMIHRLTGIPFSFTAHAHDLYVHQAGLRQKAAAATFVATISRYNVARLRELLPEAAASRIEHVHCGIEPELYAEARAVNRSGRLRLLCVASLQPYKGHDVLLAALDRLRGRLAFHCRLLGGGDLRAALERRIRERGLTGLAQLGGPATEAEVRAALRASDVFVLPSVREASGKMEGLPVAIMEAMAAGLPVVASNLSGIPELVADGVTGLLAPPGDAPALAEAMARLRDPDLRAALGERARAKVRAEFNIRDSARRLEALFRAGAGAPREAAGVGAA